MGINACILTNNEEESIEKCLQNMAPYVDEIVIVDGFSEDGTVEIARNIQMRFFGSRKSSSFWKSEKALYVGIKY